MMSRALSVLAVVCLLFIPPVYGQETIPPTGSLEAFESYEALADFIVDLYERWERQREAARCKGEATFQVHATATPAGRPGAVVVGTVFDIEGGEPLPGVNLTVDGTAIGTVTGTDGQFRLELDAAQVQAHPTIPLKTSYIGYDGQQATFSISAGDSVVTRFSICPGELMLDEVAVAGIPAAESITNVQHAGVDEGGIVKMHGDHLVILRRGRLFTVDISDGGLAPVDVVDAYGPGLDPSYAWYDEMLIVGRIVVVIGYSYERGGTEIGLFEIDETGHLFYQATYHLRSNDYYSARNYASRVVDGKLVFYAPLSLWAYQDDPPSVADLLPGLRRWRAEADKGAFEPIAEATSIFLPAREIDPENIALHTVTTCEIDRGDLDCEAQVVFGPFGHTFYVSPTAVYVWVSEWEHSINDLVSSVLYRMPLDGSRPSALGVTGAPIDQFSFLESDDAHLNVLVSESSYGQWMWDSETPHPYLSLLRIPSTGFGDGRDDAPAAWYRQLPASYDGSLRNRFIGDYLLYGAYQGWDRLEGDEYAPVYVTNWRTGDVSSVWLPHETERIEAMGRHAVVVGTGNDALHVTSLYLGKRVAAAEQYTLADASQSEERSHGFFYRPTDELQGLLGLPVREPTASSHPYLWEGAASILYLRNDSLNLRLLGSLAAEPDRNNDDACEASCVDWYGNARPLFIRERIFALMGYEIVEGRLRQGQLQEIRRISFAPRQPTSNKR